MKAANGQTKKQPNSPNQEESFLTWDAYLLCVSRLPLYHLQQANRAASALALAELIAYKEQGSVHGRLGTSTYLDWHLPFGIWIVLTAFRILHALHCVSCLAVRQWTFAPAACASILSFCS